LVDALASLTSKGRVTIPKPIREALELHEGDEIVFRVERKRAIIAKTLDFLVMAGSVGVPSSKRGTPWDEVLARTHLARAEERREPKLPPQ
jgi:antitoxin PrlF